MSSATEFDQYEHIGGINYRTTDDFTWAIGKSDGPKIIIRSGFEFQSSVPKVLRWLVSPHHPAWIVSAIIHDWFLNNGYDTLFAAGEWYRSAIAKSDRILKDTDKRDSKSWLIWPAYRAIVIWTFKGLKK